MNSYIFSCSSVVQESRSLKNTTEEALNFGLLHSFHIDPAQNYFILCKGKHIFWFPNVSGSSEM